ncbi:MAG TPA: hypothetical protein VFM99_01240, partial [Chitinophagales bacterium]|nr:hypothetical protein [Chitinophagales bacterium]
AVGSGNVAFQPSSKWNINFSYSNFTNYSRNRPVSDPFYVVTPADTMKFYQISQNANAIVAHNFGNTKLRNSVSLLAAYQVSSQQVGAVFLVPTKVWNGNIGYGLQFVPTKTTLNFTVNGNTCTAQNIHTMYLGPGINFGKSFLRNSLNFSIGSIYNISYVNEKKGGSIWNERINVGYTPKLKDNKFGKPTATVSLNYISKQKTDVNAGLKEFTLNFNLGYSF